MLRRMYQQSCRAAELQSGGGGTWFKLLLEVRCYQRNLLCTADHGNLFLTFRYKQVLIHINRFSSYTFRTQIYSIVTSMLILMESHKLLHTKPLPPSLPPSSSTAHGSMLSIGINNSIYPKLRWPCTAERCPAFASAAHPAAAASSPLCGLGRAVRSPLERELLALT